MATQKPKKSASSSKKSTRKSSAASQNSSAKKTTAPKKSSTRVSKSKKLTRGKEKQTRLSSLITSIALLIGALSLAAIAISQFTNFDFNKAVSEKGLKSAGGNTISGKYVCRIEGREVSSFMLYGNGTGIYHSKEYGLKSKAMYRVYKDIITINGFSFKIINSNTIQQLDGGGQKIGVICTK